MKKLFLVMLMLSTSAFAVPSVNGDYELDRMNPIARKYNLGTDLQYASGGLRGTYDYSVQGGAVGSVNLKGRLGENIVIPNGAIIKRCVIDTVTSLASATGSVVQLSSKLVGDLKAFRNASAYSGRENCVPDGTISTVIKLASDTTLTFQIASEALTAGKFNVFVEYYLAQ